MVAHPRGDAISVVKIQREVRGTGEILQRFRHRVPAALKCGVRGRSRRAHDNIGPRHFGQLDDHRTVTTPFGFISYDDLPHEAYPAF